MSIDSRERSMIEPMVTTGARGVCTVKLVISNEHLTLELRGALDAESVPALTAQFDRIQCTTCERVVVDVRGVDVLDHAGCNAIAGLAHYVSVRGGDFSLWCEPGAIKGMLAAIGLSAHLREAGPELRVRTSEKPPEPAAPDPIEV